MIRDAVLTLTLTCLVLLWTDMKPKPKAVSTPYCVVDVRVAGKDRFGNFHFKWGQDYRPCSEQNRFINS